jgi:hypothetical protein
MKISNLLRKYVIALLLLSCTAHIHAEPAAILLLATLKKVAAATFLKLKVDALQGRFKEVIEKVATKYPLGSWLKVGTFVSIPFMAHDYYLSSQLLETQSALAAATTKLQSTESALTVLKNMSILDHAQHFMTNNPGKTLLGGFAAATGVYLASQAFVGKRSKHESPAVSPVTINNFYGSATPTTNVENNPVKGI